MQCFPLHPDKWRKRAFPSALNRSQSRKDCETSDSAKSITHLEVSVSTVVCDKIVSFPVLRSDCFLIRCLPMIRLDTGGRGCPSGGSGRCPKNLQGASPLTRYLTYANAWTAARLPWITMCTAHGQAVHNGKSSRYTQPAHNPHTRLPTAS